MTSGITEHSLFRQPRSKAETKADVTDRTARDIIGAEAEKRERKTERLRLARLEMEAKAPAEEPAKPRKAKAPAVRRAKSSK